MLSIVAKDLFHSGNLQTYICRKRCVFHFSSDLLLQIRTLFANLGVELSDEKFSGLWDSAARHHPLGEVRDLLFEQLCAKWHPALAACFCLVLAFAPHCSVVQCYRICVCRLIASVSYKCTGQRGELSLCTRVFVMLQSFVPPSVSSSAHQLCIVGHLNSRTQRLYCYSALWCSLCSWDRLFDGFLIYVCVVASRLLHSMLNSRFLL